MSKINWNRLGFFALGTFTGGYALGIVSSFFGRRGG